MNLRPTCFKHSGVLAFGLALFLLIGMGIAPAVQTVGSGVTFDHADIASAVAASSAGEEIRIDYTYTDPSTAHTILSNDVSLVSWDFTAGERRPGATMDRFHQVIGGTYTVYGMNITPSAFDCVIISDNPSTMTFVECTMDATATGGWGMNIWNNFAGTPSVRLTSCTVTNTAAGSMAINSIDPTSMTIENSLLDTANVGIFVDPGGEFSDEDEADGSTLTLKNTTITNISFWGAICVFSKDTTINVLDGSQLVNNGERGVLFGWHLRGDGTKISKGSVLEISDSVVSNNGWSGLHIEGEDNVVTVTNSQINGNGSVQVGISDFDSCGFFQQAARTLVTLDNVELIGNAGDGTRYAFPGAANSTVNLTDCDIRNNGDRGVVFQAQPGTLNMTGCVVDNNGYRTGFWDRRIGLLCDAQDVIANLDDCTFSNNAERGVFGTYWTLRSDFTITSCSFDSNGTQGMAFDTNLDANQPVQEVTLTISDSEFVNNGWEGLVTNSPYMSFDISNTVFHNNGEVANVDGMLVLNADSGWVLSPMVLDNCQFTSNSRGGFYNSGRHTITMTDCAFENNVEVGFLVNDGDVAGSTFGGSIVATRCSFDNNADPAGWDQAAGAFIWTVFPGTFLDCTFNNNGDKTVSNTGRGFRTWDPPANGVEHQFNNCQFNNNSGRGVEFNQQVIATFENCEFLDNGAQGIFREGNNGDVANARLLTELYIDNCTFSGNAEEGIEAFSAGVLVDIQDSSIVGTSQTAINIRNEWQFDEAQVASLVADRCTFQALGNDPGLDNIAVVNSNPATTVTNCLITGGRYAIVNGSPTRSDPSTTTVMWNRPSTVTIRHCTVLGYDGSNGVLSYGSDNVYTEVVNSIFDGQTTASVETRGDFITTPTIVLARNIVRGPVIKAWGNNFSDNPSSGSMLLALPADNFTSAPLFVSTNTLVLDGDYHLQAGSPAIDAALDLGVALDIEQGSRDASPDLGAYEFGASDLTAPDASLTANDINLDDAGSSHTFRVNYNDPSLVLFSSIGNGDVVVTSDGYSQAATLVSTNASGDASPIIATYRITSPGASWAVSDIGEYTVTLQAGQVEDTVGNAVGTEVLGSFEILPGGSTVPTAAECWELY